MTWNNGNENNEQKKIAIFYEHPEWFIPLFAELERRGVFYDALPANAHQYDPTERQSPYALVVNRMSPSAHARGHAHAIFYTLQYMAHLEQIGANVLNGFDAYLYEFSKARQLGLLQRLGVRYPKARVFNHPSQAVSAAEGLEYPVIVKPNVGGSGAGIRAFNSREALETAVAANDIDLGLDGVGLLQEYLPARGNSIMRVEILNGEYLYAIRLHLQLENSFNLCPADYCDLPQNQQANGVSGSRLLVEGYTPPQNVIDTVKRITAAAHIEVGGVEYLINDRNGQIYYYDVNALSNFVADAPNVVGFDPFPRLVDFLLQRAGISHRDLILSPAM